MKKICERGLNWFQIYDYRGNVRQCSWTEDGYIGNLQDNTVYEVYHSKEAQKIRNRLTSGDYSLCKVDACPYLAMNEIEEHLLEYEDTPKYPTELYLGFERVCNYACTCCGIHKQMMEEKNENLEVHYAKIEERLQPLLPHLKKIGANGCGELFCSKHTLNILANWKPLAAPEEVEVILESNGSLFDEHHWKKIQNLGKYNLRVAISVMSFDEPIYQYLSGTNLPIARIENNLKFIRSLREKGVINFFEIATVVQEQNFRTIPAFVKKCIEEYNPDYIRLRPYKSPIHSVRHCLCKFQASAFLLRCFIYFFHIPLRHTFSVFLCKADGSFFRKYILLKNLFKHCKISCIIKLSDCFVSIFKNFTDHFLFRLKYCLALSHI